LRSISLLVNTFILGATVAACSSTTKDETPLGTANVGVYTLAIHQEKAMVAPGALTRFVIKASGGMPTSITGWVGTMGAEGSMKALASYDAGDSDFDDDVTSPAVIPPGSKYWFEVVTGDKKELGSIDFKR
jgi:hypothetical protein